jgi:hypothetical protein
MGRRVNLVLARGTVVAAALGCYLLEIRYPLNLSQRDSFQSAERREFYKRLIFSMRTPIHRLSPILFTPQGGPGEIIPPGGEVQERQRLSWPPEAFS